MLYSTEVFTSVLYFVFYRHRGGGLRNAAIRLSVPADTGMQHLAPRPAARTADLSVHGSISVAISRRHIVSLHDTLFLSLWVPT